nr:unnamed protein product [Callosobruchus chinensis]
MQLNTQEMVDMIYILGECIKNSWLASRVYKERFPDRRHPDPRSFERVMGRYDRTGTVKYEKHERRKRVLVNEDNEFDVLATVVEDPHSSAAEISHDLGIAPLSVVNIFSDIVIFEDLLADLRDEYKTHTIQTSNPMISMLFPFDFLPKMPHRPGLHSSRIK